VGGNQRRSLYLISFILLLGLAALGMALLLGKAAVQRRSGGASPVATAPSGASPAPAGLAWPPDWGELPDDKYDMAEVWPPLPAAQGWASFQAHGRLDPLAAGHGLVVLSPEGGRALTALDLRSGRQLWQVDLPDFNGWTGPPVFLHDKAVLVPAGGTVALDPQRGKQLWTNTELNILAVGAAGIWAVPHGPGPSFGGGQPTIGDDLALLDAGTGEILQEFDLGPLYGYAEQIPADGTAMAVATETELVIAHSDGSAERVPRARPGWFALLCLDVAGVLECSCGPVPAEASNAWVSREFARAGRRRPGELVTVPEARAGAENGVVEARLLALPGFAPQWKTAWVDFRFAANGRGNLRLDRDAVAVCGQGVWDVQTIDRASGQRRQVVNLGRLESSRAYPLGDQVFVYIGPQSGLAPEEIPYQSSWLDPATGRLTAVPWQPVDWPPALYADGRLCYLAAGSGQPDWDGSALPSTAVVCLEVDAALAPLPGTLALAAEPEPFTALVKQFYTVTEPLVDQRLMRKAVAAGLRGYGRLCSGAEAAQPAQLDALVRLGAYLELQQATRHPEPGEPGEMPVARPRASLVAALRQRGAGLEQELSHWVADPQLAVLRPQLAALLIEAGGTAAQAFAQAEYPFVLPPQPLALPAGPLAVEREMKQPDGTSTWRAWAEAAGTDGTHYAVFTADWLRSANDVFLGIDPDGDARFDRVLPLGLVHSALAAAPGAEPADQGNPPLQLTLRSSALEVGHFDRPLTLQEGTYYAEPGTGRFKTARLGMREVQLDTDGDGLTDIAENLLFLDTQGSDSDDDGLKDNVDPSPNADSRQMGQLERGVARALGMYFRPPLSGAGEPPRPYRAVFIAVSGCQPVALDLPGTYAVCLTQKQDKRALARHAGAEPVWVSVSPRAAKPATEPPATSEPGLQEWDVSVQQQYSGEDFVLHPLNGELYPTVHRETWYD
jgi:hypothetical protein